MGVKWWFLCVLHQIIITTSFGTVKLPFTDVQAPPLPKPSLPENGLTKLSSPINPKLRKALIEYFKLKYLETSQLSNTEESSSPAIISSSSKVLPFPDVQTNTVDDTFDVLIKPNILTEASIPFSNKVTLTTTPIVPSIYERGTPFGVPLPSITSLPIISLESLKRNIESLGAVSYSPNLYTPSDSKMYFDVYPTSNQLYSVPYPMHYNRVSLPDVKTPDFMISINRGENLRSTSPNSFKIMNDYPNVYPLTSTQGCYALNLAPPLSTLNNENSNSIITQRLPKVPLLVSTSPNRCLDSQQYNYMNQNKYGRKIGPMYYQDYLNTVAPLPYLRNCNIAYLAPGFNLGSPYYPTMSSYGIWRALPEPNIPKANQFGFKMDYEASPLSANELNAHIGNIKNDCPEDTQPTIDIIIDTTIYCDILDNIEDIITGKISNLDLSELSKESTVTIQVKPPESSLDKSSLVQPIDLPFPNSKGNIEPSVLFENTVSDVCPLTKLCDPPKLPQPIFPVTYINTSPTYALSQSSANAISALNDVVSSITRNILNSFASCLTNTQAKVTNTVSPISYTTPALGLYNTNSMKPRVPQYVHTSIFSPFNTYPATTFSPLEPTFYDNMPSTTTNTYSNDVTASPSETSSPIKVNLLPPTSFLDYLPSQSSPSTLPLPILPSYIDTSTSFTHMPQILNMKSLDSRSKTIERLLDMVFLAESEHGEEYIDWDALDTVLTILYAGK